MFFFLSSNTDHSNEKESNTYEAVFASKAPGHMEIRDVPSLTSVTVCLWMQSANTSTIGTPFLYRTHLYESVIDGIGLLNDKRLAVVIMGQER